MVPSQGGRAQLRGRLIVRSGCLQLWSELPALAPGARCQSGRSVGSGAPGAVQWTATGLTRQERQRSVESVGAGAGSSAHSWLVLRGGVVHQRSLRIPLPSPSSGAPLEATAPHQDDTARHRGQRLFMKGLHSGRWDGVAAPRQQDRGAPAPAPDGISLSPPPAPSRR